MVKRVPKEKIEEIVGVKRADYEHWGIARSKDQQVYVLHSQACLDTDRIMYDCIYTVAQERGIDLDRWQEDVPAQLRVEGGRLVPREADTSGKANKRLTRKRK